ncbi:DUF1877 family protein [Cryobacterium fucosi]|uniref:DUF1877 family protein n=1 Tax=Cryobacterium fucosi TaxID=1259157 RepID=A0A4R9B263_9MICO|nr:DUF1877 family protein [Cryobacterium fucosi]TFD74493.1 DUF1877 family protein [Cryobacterium fucosi]
MGIRYYAYPIAATDYLRALADPCQFLGTDPLMDAWGPTTIRPEMLYLDKCWREFQGMLGPAPGVPARAAFQLVEGQVTQVEMGWIAFERALSPAQVKAIAADLATVDDTDIRSLLASYPDRADSSEMEHRYIGHYLAAAQEFSSRLASDGRGLVYLIG